MNELKPINVHIKNFQSIKDIEFQIKGFTCLVGVTNIGKSAIIRAISSAILNNPVIGMVRKGEPNSMVRLSCDEWDFTWEKGEKGINRYTIDGKVLDKVGSKQLDEIADLGFKSVRIGSDALHPWLASQFFPIFLLDKPGSQVTDFISEVSRLNVLQDAILISAKGKRNSNDEAQRSDLELKSAERDLSRYSGFNILSDLEQDIGKQIESINEYEKNIDLMTKTLSVLESIKSNILVFRPVQSLTIPDSLSDEYENCKGAVDILHKIDSCNSDINIVSKVDIVGIPSVVDAYDTVIAMNRFIGLQDEINLVDRLSRVDSLTISEDEPGQLTTINILESISRKIALLSGLHKIEDVAFPDVLEISPYVTAESILNNLVSAANDIKELSQKKSKCEDIMKDAERHISSIPTCPTCSRPHAECA